MKKVFATMILATMLMSATPAAFAGTHGVDRQVTGKSIAGGLASLIIWPGIGQIVNDQSKEKVVTHALLGLTGIFRFWSCYDGIANRNGGVWENRI